MKNFFLLLSIFFVVVCQYSCHIDKWDLDDKSNEIIPSYSNSFQGLACKDSFNTDIYEIDDNTFVTAILADDGNAKVIEINQMLDKEKWEIDYLEKISSPADQLLGFVKTDSSYYILTSLNGNLSINSYNLDFNPKAQFNDFFGYIDTSYNKISGIELANLTVDRTSNTFIYGQLTSFQKKYSFVLKLDPSLKPVYLRTYFENTKIQSLVMLEDDGFLFVNQENEAFSLIADNDDRKNYKKYDVKLSETLMSPIILHHENKLYLSGYNNSGFASIMNISLANKTIFIQDIQNYQVKDFKTGISQESTVLITGVNSIQNEGLVFLSEYNGNYLWCNTFDDVKYTETLALRSLKKLGRIYLYLVESNGKSLLHIIRTDNEGATIDNPYKSNCL